ncbi:hypothetical protein H257_11589 [Aphanomyces astaci]|uniref:Uncharacterized protein n=1 Tax=Aphanomyces astaci TaxID=112090 RepID=W4G166_APHAT|nr:hypothetical protein H257_11589 [Aphanomyces astaci]ETV73452.1 hypothetical protein H257_11589 [Aphanomyces astaci]RHY04989.1 hypothetical protein DYB25_010426 [Aphanomyces astaci]RHY08748.1 hypothetical protein DYB36_003750 [Aphanomyces astaci]RHY54632.1 hypothetical protein DYB38_004166 [Aphanomyces astaci]RHY64010.1 hypothetical protein DYB34_004224 [Aphanomyces astaci]|eukprot:XP_009836878.1 hypothetical protein H257_11589 [Aphanomyces astaci]
MTFVGTAVGAVLGLNTKLLVNTLQKVPLLRQPWEHLALIGLGAVVGNLATNNVENDKKEVEALRALLGNVEQRKAVPSAQD